MIAAPDLGTIVLILIVAAIVVTAFYVAGMRRP